MNFEEIVGWGKSCGERSIARFWERWNEIE